MQNSARVLIAIVTVFVVALATHASSDNSAVPSSPSPCTLPAQRQFDFWVGTWDASWPAEKPGEVEHGTNEIRRALQDCVIQENFDGGSSMHLRGISVSAFDKHAGKWKQTWVDNEGAYLDFTGEFADGQMVLSRQATRPDGTKVLQRMVWKNIQPNQFDWSWESSKDDGKTWQVLWPIHYTRKAK